MTNLNFPHLWIVGMILIGCGKEKVSRIFGVFLLIIWIFLEFKTL